MGDRAIGLMTNKALVNQRLGPASLRTLMNEVADLHVGTTLHVTDASSERIFYFVKGGARLLSCGPHRGPGFERYLSRLTKADQRAIARVIEETRGTKKELRTVLVDKGVVSRDDVNRIVTDMVRDALMDLVFWRNAFFTLEARPPPEEIYDHERGGVSGSIENADLAKAITRWLDEWATLRQVLHSDQTRVAITPLGREEGASLARSIQTLLRECAQERSVRDLWLATVRPMDQLCKDLVELAEKKLITLTADRSWSRRSPEGEIADLEESLHHLVAKDAVRERLVLLYRRTRQPAKAVEQLKILARNALTAGNLARANEHYKLILNLEPENVETFETLIDLNGKSKLIREVKNFALNHLQRLANRSEYQAADHCARLLETLPGIGTEVVEFKASLLASRGKTREAAVECMRVAKFYDDRGDVALASHLYRKAAAYQNRPPSSADGRAGADEKRVEEPRIVSASERKSRDRRPSFDDSTRRTRLLVACLLVAAAAASFHWREELGIIRDLDRESGTATAASVRSRPSLPIVRTRSRDDARPPGARPPDGEACGDPRLFRTRILNASQQVTYADSCKLSIRDDDGKIVRELMGKVGTRWAIGDAGQFICRWAPGEPPVVFVAAEEKSLALDWSIPEVAEALAVGDDRIILRASKLTVVYDFAGVQLYESELPEWEEGVIRESHLILTRSEPSPTLWLVNVEALDRLWTCRFEPQGLVVW